MSDEYDEPNDQSNTDATPAGARARIDAQNAELKTLRDELTTIRNAQRERTVSDVLAEKGLPLKVAKYVPADLEPTKEALEQWLATDGDIFVGTGQAATVAAVQPTTDQIRMDDFESSDDGQDEPLSNEMKARLKGVTKKEDVFATILGRG